MGQGEAASCARAGAATPRASSAGTASVNPACERDGMGSSVAGGEREPVLADAVVLGGAGRGALAPRALDLGAQRAGERVADRQLGAPAVVLAAEVGGEGKPGPVVAQP